MRRFAINLKRREERKWMVKELERCIERGREVHFVLAHPHRKPMLVSCRVIEATVPGEGSTVAEQEEAGCTQPPKEGM